jgi:hypothetical protein
MDKVFLAKYDPKETRVDKLVPYDTPRFFFEEELDKIEHQLAEIHRQHFPEVEEKAAPAIPAKAGNDK